VKLARVGEPGAERPVAVLDDGRLVDLSAVTADIDTGFIADIGTGDGLSRVRARLGDLPTVEAGGRYGPPLNRPGKIVCIGLNYHDHAAETGQATPTEPVVFMKAPDTIVGPDDTVLVPRDSTKTDWEVELGVVIGRTARYLGSVEEGLEHVAGYVLSHDVSEREFQLERGGQWDKGKNSETFNPLGPWLVTTDEVPDPQVLELRLSVNGVARQRGRTSDMIFDVDYIVWYLSQFMTLYPGDVINTGTPAGVALGMPDPKPYLRAGDTVELTIDGLGRQHQIFAQA
jgi:2-keto-4-pentenoate hydratase/2-oxohepta-3-ene-1,7-dioic acid hydratase in catechol pathway